MRVLRLVVFLLLGLWVVAEVFAIPVMNKVVETDVAAKTSNAGSVHASVGSFPLLTRLVVTGRVSHASVTLDEVTGQRLPFSEIRFDVSGVALDRTALLQRKFRVQDIDTGTVTATINLADISPLAARLASRVRVQGRTLLVGPTSLAITSSLIPCVPQGRVEGERVILTCSFTQIPPVFFPAQN